MTGRRNAGKLTCRCSGGYGGTEDALVGGQIDLDGWVTARVVDLPGNNLLDWHLGCCCVSGVLYRTTDRLVGLEKTDEGLSSTDKLTRRGRTEGKSRTRETLLPSQPRQCRTATSFVDL